MQPGNLIPMVIILNCYRGTFSIQCFRCSKGDGGNTRGGEDKAIGAVGEGLAPEAFRGLPLVV